MVLGKRRMLGVSEKCLSCGPACETAKKVGRGRLGLQREGRRHKG